MPHLTIVEILRIPGSRATMLQDVPHPTAYEIMLASGQPRPTLGSLKNLRASEAKRQLMLADLTLMCLGDVPTCRGQPATTLTDDASQVVTENAS
jgi:hypothetical protein